MKNYSTAQYESQSSEQELRDACHDSQAAMQAQVTVKSPKILQIKEIVFFPLFLLLAMLVASG